MPAGLPLTGGDNLRVMPGKRVGRKRTKSPVTPPAGKPPLSSKRIGELLRSSVEGARELDRKLKSIFELSEANASLRLK